MQFGVVWSLPFVFMLLSIALLPVLLPALWHRRMDAVALAWCLALLLPEAAVFGPAAAAAAAWHAILSQYLPLLALLLALYVAGGGILIDGGPFGRPAGNTALLACGVLLAGVLGTTGAAMVLIRPLLRANAYRARRVHLVIFFILLVANAGGGTTPLGDPPLYIGFLRGVPFLWPLRNLAGPLLLVILPLLAVFYLVDRRLARAEPPCPSDTQLRIEGLANLPLVGIVVASVLLQGIWRPGTVTLLGEPIAIARLVAIAVCLLVTLLSLRLSKPAIREANGFAWGPIHEVAVLFAGLFITIGPVLAMFQAGVGGPLGPVFALTHDSAGAPIPLVYFWLTGLVSAFLDNAPAYLVAFQQAGGDATALTGPLSRTLVAISGGAVLFGGLSYVGNAPNLMVRSIAAHHGIRMPGFLAYLLIAAALLLPCLLAISLIFLR